MKKTLKVIVIFLILILALVCISNETYSFGEMFESADDFLGTGSSQSSGKINDSSLKSMSSTIYNVLLIVGVVIAVIYGLFIAIKLIMGSIDEKAKIKESLIPYVAGCVIVFGAFTIWGIVMNMLNSVS